MTEYIPTIGLEVHAELKTATKMFCGCKNDPFEAHPNMNVCPVCLSHPGALPTINKKSLEFMIQIGLAIGGKINGNFRFDRKNYFYPDLPKGYQISQLDLPVVMGGNMDISARLGEPRSIKINRVHLEEDAGKLVHSERGPSATATAGQASSGQQATLVDFNRGGVPLMELVSEPDMHSAKEAVAFAKELQLILRYLGVSDADLEHGQMRADANISLSEIRGIDADSNAEQRGNFSVNPRLDQRKSASILGTKVEVKNLNSFRAIEEAINHEIKRQGEILDSVEKVKQETRGWDEIKKKTVSQRSKEEAFDYRYFPDPDLPPLDQSAFDVKGLELAIPELPGQKRKRFKEQFQLTDDQVNYLVEDRSEAKFFEEAVSEWEADTKVESEKSKVERVQLLFNYLNSDLKGLMKEREISFSDLKINPENFADLMDMISKNEISSRTAKDLLARMADLGIDPRDIVKQEGLGQVSGEGDLLETVRAILRDNPKAVEDYKKGKGNALQFLVGKAMAAMKGRGNPGVLQELFKKELA